MKNDIHPTYIETQVTCTCGAKFTTRSTATSGKITADVCSQCHPFYTGKQKLMDTGGRVARFQARYGKKAEAKTAEAKTAEAKTAEAKTAEAKTAEANTDDAATAGAK